MKPLGYNSDGDAVWDAFKIRDYLIENGIDNTILEKYMSTIEEEIERLELERYDENFDGDLEVTGVNTSVIAEYVRTKLRELGDELKHGEILNPNCAHPDIKSWIIPLSKVDEVVWRMCKDGESETFRKEESGN